MPAVKKNGVSRRDKPQIQGFHLMDLLILGAWENKPYPLEGAQLALEEEVYVECQGWKMPQEDEGVGEVDTIDWGSQTLGWSPGTSALHVPCDSAAQPGVWVMIPRPNLGYHTTSRKNPRISGNLHNTTKQNVTIRITSTTTVKIHTINKENNTENPLFLCSHVYLSIVPVKSGARVQRYTVPWGFLRVFIWPAPTLQVILELGPFHMFLQLLLIPM